MEERAEVKKRWATTGKVQVVTHTETVEELARAVLDGEEVEIQTVELDQTVSGPSPVVRTEEDVITYQCWRKSWWWRSGSFLSARSGSRSAPPRK
jgi:hypothetical protein